MCQILVAAKRAPLAIPHLEVILEKIDEFQLEAWDPDLTLKALKMVWQGFKAQNDKTVKEQAGVILSRINRISPTVALGLK